MKLALIAILTYVIAPTLLPAFAIEGKECSHTRADKHHISHDRG